MFAGFRRGMVLDGRYLLERPLGAGGMGSVWAARQIALDREVAVKVLHAAVREGTSLRREALALAAIHHPSVVQVFDYGETEDGIPFVVMELVRGESLAALVDRVGSLHVDEALSVVLPLLEGLAAVHRAGIVHRDIKPDNVVLTADPAGPVPKLLDFGIARQHQGPHLTGTGGLVGTPPYMAPEQVRSGDTDERTDVWGVAALFYTLIAGAPPFGDGEPFDVLRRVVELPPPYPRQARGLDGRLWAILMSALRKDRAERTRSAGALAEALAAWRAGRGRAAPIPAIPAPDLLAPPAASLAVTLPAQGPSSAPADEEAPSIDRLIRTKLGQD
jgi:serine/threonine-protein kinase